ncbi:MAG: hypothetical protein LBP39_00420 [Rickettsiales bacterium]|jgi:hypothetical protein|nr:hypothetical protein [Rickettsiales bacterium]
MEKNRKSDEIKEKISKRPKEIFQTVLPSFAVATCVFLFYHSGQMTTVVVSAIVVLIFTKLGLFKLIRDLTILVLVALVNSLSRSSKISGKSNYRRYRRFLVLPFVSKTLFRPLLSLGSKLIDTSSRIAKSLVIFSLKIFSSLAARRKILTKSGSRLAGAIRKCCRMLTNIIRMELNGLSTIKSRNDRIRRNLTNKVKNIKLVDGSKKSILEMIRPTRKKLGELKVTKSKNNEIFSNLAIATINPKLFRKELNESKVTKSRNNEVFSNLSDIIAARDIKIPVKTLQKTPEMHVKQPEHKYSKLPSSFGDHIEKHRKSVSKILKRKNRSLENRGQIKIRNAQKEEHLPNALERIKKKINFSTLSNKRRLKEKIKHEENTIKGEKPISTIQPPPSRILRYYHRPTPARGRLNI